MLVYCIIISICILTVVGMCLYASLIKFWPYNLSLSLKNYQFKKIGPGHGDFLENPINVVDWIINHRIERENKVIAKLKIASPVSSKKLVEDVYDDVDKKLHPIAIWSLEAHLHKLLDDGIATFDSKNKTWSSS